MTPEKLKAWLSENGKTVIDVAAGTKVHPVTVEKFLKGGRCQPVVIEAIRRYVADATHSQLIYEVSPKASTASRRLK